MLSIHDAQNKKYRLSTIPESETFLYDKKCFNHIYISKWAQCKSMNILTILANINFHRKAALEFTFTENSCTKAICSISRIHVSLQFWILKGTSWPIHVIWDISHEIKLNFDFVHSKLRKIVKLSFIKFTIHANSETWNQVNARLM